MPWMLFDRSEINEVKQRCSCGINAVVELPAFLVRQSRGLYKGRRAIKVLLEKHRRLNATRITLQDGGPILKIGHNIICDSEIIAKQIKFGEFLVRPVDAIQACDRHLLATDLQDQVASGPEKT